MSMDVIDLVSRWWFGMFNGKRKSTTITYTKIKVHDSVLSLPPSLQKSMVRSHRTLCAVPSDDSVKTII